MIAEPQGRGYATNMLGVEWVAALRVGNAEIVRPSAGSRLGELLGLA